jgi:hypothetical protein
VVVLLTAASSRSNMVKGEVEIALDQAGKSGIGKPRILPVRLAYTGRLPYPLNAWLDPIQYALWRGEAETSQLLRELEDAICGKALSRPALALGPAAPRDEDPLPSAPLPTPGGALDTEDQWYIRRASDTDAERLAPQRGITLVIKGSRQMGKSSLLVRTLSAAIREGKRCALIDFQLLGRQALQSSATFFQVLAKSVAEQLDLTQDISCFWDDGLPEPRNLTRYIEKQVLRSLDTPFVLAIDEADILFQADFLYDFFGMLRSWHNARANPLNEKIWKKLDLVLVTSTEPYLLIDRPHESPFNVGLVLELADFSREQVLKLNTLHDSPLYPHEVNKLYDLLQGQPYLTRKAFYAVKTGLTPDQLFAQAPSDSGPFGDHLRSYFLRMLNNPELTAALKQVAVGQGRVDGKIAYRLRGAGLVKQESGKIVPRCRLYAEYFGARL